MEKKKRGRPRKPRISTEPINEGSAYVRVNDKKIAVGVTSDGSSADYYVLPSRAKELQDLISHKNMNAQIGEIFRSCFRFGQAEHSDKVRDAKKIFFYISAEIKRLLGAPAYHAWCKEEIVRLQREVDIMEGKKDGS